MPIQSPYPGAEIITKDIGQVLEEFIQSEWSLVDPGLGVSNIGWGLAGTKMDKHRKNITIRAKQITSDIRDMALGGHKNSYFELWWIDIFVRDVKTTTDRSPKLNKILKHVEHIFLENKTGLQSKGISSVNVYKSTPVENPDSEDVYHAILGLELRYITELV